jgi:hypothetical protein
LVILIEKRLTEEKPGLVPGFSFFGNYDYLETLAGSRMSAVCSIWENYQITVCELTVKNIKNK